MLLRNVQVPDVDDASGRVDVELAGARVGAVHGVSGDPTGATRPSDLDALAHATELDLTGWVLLPALAEPHVHLDKARTAAVAPNPDGDLAGAAAAWAQHRQALAPRPASAPRRSCGSCSVMGPPACAATSTSTLRSGSTRCGSCSPCGPGGRSSSTCSWWGCRRRR